MPYNIPDYLKGLTNQEVITSRKRFGSNQIDKAEKTPSLKILIQALKDPMLILLIVISIIYILTGNQGEALFMLAAIIAVSAISFYQDNRSKKALKELEKLNEPLSIVIRNGTVAEIPTHQIVIGDLCITEEGKMINADGRVVYGNDFSVNESALTGESFSVFKDNSPENNQVYSGTSTVSGLAVFEVEKIGQATRIGKIGESLIAIKEDKSPLQIQISKFVKSMAVIGIIIFLLVWAYSFYQSHNVIVSLLNGLTLAMSILPEEIPVAFTTFMALGAWKLMRQGIIVKRSSMVETLGSTTVICTDKTGTITENSMQLKQLYEYKSDRIFSLEDFQSEELLELISYAMWSSEPVPFDPMEKSIHSVYTQVIINDLRRKFVMHHEYPLSGKPPMMTHIFESQSKERIIAAKGAPEAILAVCTLPEVEKAKIRTRIKLFGQQGYRVLGVAKAQFSGSYFPKAQQEFDFGFLGLTVFYDPPKKEITEVFKTIYAAGIKLKVITGDNADTTRAIAQQAGIREMNYCLSGDEVSALSEKELLSAAERTTLFTRMFPEAKLAVVNALKQQGEVVAMLGDGVNDGPALKAAHIGVAMGNKGTDIAKAAAALVITNDDLQKLVIGIADGRRIYANLKKAIQYIISIHIPIILTVSLPLFLQWIYPEILTPVHVIFLELIMGPTCSIVYESEPMEKNSMMRPPRAMSNIFLNIQELGISIVQGLIITVGVLAAYQISISQGGNEEKTRAMVFATLILANILLSLSNRSFYYSIIETFKNKNPLLMGITVLVLLLLFVILYVEHFSQFFHVTSLSANELGISFIIAAISVFWFEGYKMTKRLRNRN